MGQYYMIVNLTKRQFLDPHKFGDGLKLMEFGPSGEGIMLGLAILLAQSNGRGSGDLYREVENGTKEDLSPHERIDHKFSVTDHKANKKIPHWIVVPSIVGDWAGDKIIVAGDYADNGQLMTQSDMRKAIPAVLADLKKAYTDPEYIKNWGQEHADQELAQRSERAKQGEINLYKMCMVGLFTDISNDVLEAILCDEYFRAGKVHQWATSYMFDHDPPASIAAEVKKLKKELISGKVVMNYGLGVKITKRATVNTRTGVIDCGISDHDLQITAINDGKASAVFIQTGWKDEPIASYPVCPECGKSLMKLRKGEPKCQNADCPSRKKKTKASR